MNIPEVKYLLILFLSVLSLNLSASEPDSLSLPDDNWIKVDSILIRGNEKTENFVITRELSFKKGDKINTKLIEFNRERVYSLGLFNFVSMKMVQHDSLNFVEIDVEESWYIYPIPILDLNGKNFTNATYGLALLYRNFRGRNETIQTIAAFGYDPFFLLTYLNPLLIEKYDINFTSSVLYQTPVNKSISAEKIHGRPFEYKGASGLFTFGKRLNQYNDLYVSAGYQYVEIPGNNFKGITASGYPIDRTIILGASYIHDTRDLKQFPKNGLFTKVEYLNKGFINNISYNIFSVDFREYRTVHNDLTSKWRVAYKASFGKMVPLYDFFFFGYMDYIRGHREDFREGRYAMITSLEFAHPIIKEWNVSMDLPLLPKSLTSARVALHMHMFYDAGITYNTTKALTFNNFDSGWGFGFTILVLPYNALRIEYAINKYGTGEFLLGSGFSF